MSLHLHHAERTDVLADGLGDLLAEPLADPFASEVVVVPARGVERWLTQRLSHRLGAAGPARDDGVCAGVRFLSPRSLVALLLGRPDDDPWDPDHLVWPLLEVVDDVLGEPGFEALSRHLGHGATHHGADHGADHRAARRYAVARRLAGLLASYAVQRPALLAAWEAGDDADGAGGPLDDDLHWQPELWRRLTERVGAPTPLDRHADTLTRLRAGGDGLDLPGRLSLFGHTRLPRTEVELLQALGEHRAVHLWLPQVSGDLWQALAPTATGEPVPRAEDDSRAAVGHPLLASLGRDARELRRTLGPVEATSGPRPATPETLLGRLQHDLRRNAVPTSAERAARTLDPRDRSVQVHACHGAARQVEVLREVLVGILQDDPTLEPRDIVVMCPDIETYAPLISAAFGLADLELPGGRAGERAAGHPAHQLRVRLADRALSATNPLLALAARLVELAGGRLGATEVLDVASAEPVRRRFGLGDDELERVTAWVREAGVRWGYDLSQRAAFGVAVESNTWLAGLRRVLLGVAVSADGHRHVRGTLPLDSVGDGEIELVGALVELVDRIHRFLGAAAAATSVDDWADALGEAVHGLTAAGVDDAWQVAQLERELARLSSGAAGHGTVLRQADVRALLRHRLRGRPTRANFRTGTLTVCTLVPMRSVPHRVVCLVGLDDGVYPRQPVVDGDDVLARRPLTGERDARSEDRQLLLDAVVAAEQTLVVTYTGHAELSATDRPPAVPLGELLDALDLTAAAPAGGAVRDHVVVHHPLQPHDERNLLPGALTGTEPFSFDRAALAGATAARTPRAVVRTLVPEPLPALPAADLTLADLHEFLAHPVRAFCRRRLAVSTPRELDRVTDAIPIELDGLERWGVGDRLVADVLAGADPQAGMVAEQLRGLLPPRALGVGVLSGVVAQARPLVEGVLGLRAGHPERTVDLAVDLPDGRRLTGSVAGVHAGNVVRVSYSSLGAKHRVAGWLDAVALGAGRPEHNWTVHTVGRYRSGGRRALVAPLPEADALRLLTGLVDLYDRGMREPLPLPLRTSLAFAEEARLSGATDGRADERASAAWVTPRFLDGGIPGDDADAWHVCAFGERAGYDVLASPLRATDADLPVADPASPHRLAAFATALWWPILDHELVRAL